MFFLLNTVSYAAMTLPFLINEEIAFRTSKTFLDMQKQERQNRFKTIIYQTMHLGRILPMFSPDHHIQPPKSLQVNDDTTTF